MGGWMKCLIYWILYIKLWLKKKSIYVKENKIQLTFQNKIWYHINQKGFFHVLMFVLNIEGGVTSYSLLKSYWAAWWEM